MQTTLLQEALDAIVYLQRVSGSEYHKVTADKLRAALASPVSAGIAGDERALFEALTRLESANEALCRLRSQEQYLSMVDSGQQDAIIELDNARQAARAALAAVPAQPTQPQPDPFAWVICDGMPRKPVLTVYSAAEAAEYRADHVTPLYAQPQQVEGASALQAEPAGQLDAALAALRPFAAMAGMYSDEADSDPVILIGDGDKWVKLTVGNYRAAHAAVSAGLSPTESTLSPEPAKVGGAGDADWRSLALQFDNHRMQAIWFLKALLKDQRYMDEVAKFLAAPPLSGEIVLAERIQALAANASGVQAADLAKLTKHTGANIATIYVMEQEDFYLASDVEALFNQLSQGETKK